MTGEGLSRVLLLRNDFTRLRFDDDAVRPVDHVPVRIAEGFGACPLTTEFRRHGTGCIVDFDTFHTPEEAACDHFGGHLIEVAPPIKAAVDGKNFRQKSVCYGGHLQAPFLFGS
jgi:hypothetical protein